MHPENARSVSGFLATVGVHCLGMRSWQRPAGALPEDKGWGITSRTDKEESHRVRTPEGADFFQPLVQSGTNTSPSLGL
jgi:hypothetical protein